jgi:hypothetical protein
MPIYFWSFNGPSPNDDAVSLVYTIPVGETNPATLESLFNRCNLSGLSYRENGSGDADDELWIADAQRQDVGKFRLADCSTGILNQQCLTGFAAAEDVDPTLNDLHGLALDLERVYLSSASCSTCSGRGEVFRAIEDSSELTALGTLVENSGRWLADMECDNVSFAPDTVMWVRTSPQNRPGHNIATAYEIEAGACNSNTPLGACCEANVGECRDHVPPSSCSGSWEAGKECSELTSPCFAAHMIVVLDRTGSMQALRPESGNTRCVDAVAAAEYDIKQFFNTNPPGSTVAVWTFAGTGPTQLTVGFVDEATAVSALHTLDSVPCNNFTPLAESICEAVDAMAAEFPFASPQTLKVAISSDGEENNSDGSCLGPPSSGGTACVGFDDGSWQKQVCDHVQGKATVIVRYWNDFDIGMVAGGKSDAETGEFLAANVSDAMFFLALAEATGGSYQAVRDIPVPSSSESAFGAIGACCVASVGCYEQINQAECAVLNGTHQGESSTCAAANCGTTIPTVSTWGFVVLAGFVLTAGTLVLRRRSASPVF